MKSHICPKCNSSDIIKIGGNRMNSNMMISLKKWGTMTAAIDRYICLSCGFIEEWVKMDQKFLKWVEKNRNTGNLDSDFV